MSQCRFLDPLSTSQDAAPSGEEIDASKLAEVNRVTVMEAEPGAGKTTTLQFLAWQHADGLLGGKSGYSHVPVYAELKLLSHRGQTIEAAVEQALKSANGQAGPIPWDTLLLLVDGVNEVAPQCQTNFKTELRDLLSRFPKLRIVVAGRTNSFRGEFEARIVVLQRLTDKQLADLFQCALGDHGKAIALLASVRRSPFLSSWTRTPLHAAMVVDVAKRDGIDALTNHSTTVRRFVRRFLNREFGQAPGQTLLLTKARLLARLAFETKAAGQLTFTKVAALSTFGTAKAQVGATNLDVPKFIQEVLDNHLLQQADPEALEFAHELYHDYFTATELETREQIRPGLGAEFALAHFSETHWNECVRLFAGISKTGRILVERGAEKNPFLAWQLLRDASDETRDLSERISLGRLDRNALMRAFGQLSAGVGERIRALYETADAEGHICDALYFFWVKSLPCPACSASVDLFPTYIFARNAYPDRKPEVRIVCPECAGIFSADVKDEEARCPHCDHRFDLQGGPASGASATCQKCRHVFPIAKTAKGIGHPPAHRMFAKLVLNSSGEKLYLPVTRKDELAYQRCSEQLRRSKLPLPTLELKDGYNTRQVLNYAYRSWNEFFNDRQLLALGWLHTAILDLPDDGARAALRTVFSGVLEFNNMFASYKGEGTGAIRHMFAHHILKPERVPIEGNVWGTSKSSGSFSTLFKSRLLRAIEYHSAPFELEIERTNGRGSGKRVFGGSPPFTGHVETKWPLPPKPASRAIYLSCGSLASTGLAEASVDLIVTDPPFFDNVHYSELADFFFAWQQLSPSPFVGKRMTTRHSEEVQDTSPEKFASKLRAVFAECCRVLRKDGLLVFTYHHSRMDGWTSLADAVVGAGLSLVNCHPVKSEMSVAAPKSQAKEPIQLDVIMGCRKQRADIRKKADAKLAFQRSVEHATAKASRLKECGLALSVNDRRVILISQFIVEISAGRSAEELSSTLSRNLTDLDLAEIRLRESQTAHASAKAKRIEQQLALFDRTTAKQSSKDRSRVVATVSYRQTRRRPHSGPSL